MTALLLAIGLSLPALAAPAPASATALSQSAAPSATTASQPTLAPAAASATVPASPSAESVGVSPSGETAAPASAGAAASARRFVPIVEADVRGALGKMSSDRWNGGVVGSVFALPAYRVADRTTLLPIYAFAGGMLNQPVEVEDVLFLQMQQTHSLSLGVKQGLAGRLDGRLSVEGGWTITRETRGETFGHGLYDYRDFGGRGSVTWDPGLSGRRSPVAATVRLYERWYPNYGSLATEDAQNLITESPALLAELGGREQHPKDFHAVEPGASAAWWPTRSIQARLGWSTAFRAYTDRYLRTDQGALSGTRRADQLHRLTAGGTVRALPAVTTGLELTWIVNVSNQTVYNAGQPVHAYIPDFYDFSSMTLEPWVMWVVPVRRALKPRVRLGGFLLTRAFAGRLTQYPDGTYTDSRQHDAFWGADLAGWYPLNRWLSVAVGVNARVARSNNLSEQSIRYRYEGLACSLGVAISY